MNDALCLLFLHQIVQILIEEFKTVDLIRQSFFAFLCIPHFQNQSGGVREFKGLNLFLLKQLTDLRIVGCRRLVHLRQTADAEEDDQKQEKETEI